MSGQQNVTVDFHDGTLRLRGVTGEFVSKGLGEIPLVWDPREPCFRCDAMFAKSLCQQLRSHLAGRLDWRVDCSDRPIAIQDRGDVKLRRDQLEAVAAFGDGDHRGLIVMPTGTGKTVVAIRLMIWHQSSALVVVPVRDLMYQWHTKILEATGIDAGLIGDGVHRVCPISVTTYDSAAIHMPRIGNRFSLIVFDEVHHLAGRWRSDAARMSAASSRLGLTATLPSDPTRLATLHSLVGPTLYQQSIKSAAGKSLADYTVRRIAVEMTADEADRYRELSRLVQQFVFQQREIDAGFRWDDCFKLVAATDDDPERAQAANRALRAFRAKRRIEEQASGKLRVLEDLFRLHADDPVIVFTGSNVMAREVSRRFLIPCLLSHCAKRERREWIEGFAAGRYRALVANRVLDEGIDLPEVKTAIVLGGLSSERQAIQRLGRVLRKSKTGQRATLYEVVTDATNEVQRSRQRRRNEAYRKR
jgi:superfamily II DNA or RNA helicase